MPSQFSAPMGFKAAFREALRTKSGLVGFGMLGLLLATSLAVPLYAPGDVISTWGSSERWLDYPRAAAPEWVGFFEGKNLPRTQILEPKTFQKAVVPSQFSNLTFIALNGSIPFNYDDFPSELSLSVFASFQTSAQVTVTLSRPDHEKVLLFQDTPALRAPTANVYSLSSVLYTDPFIKTLQGNLRNWVASKNVLDRDVIAGTNIKPEITLFANVDKDMLNPFAAKVLRGTYFLDIRMTGFSRTDNMDARFITYGKVYGLTGTDGKRRDMLVGLLWGAPVALAFGTTAALAVVLIETILGAMGGWYGGHLDEFFQRGADFFLIIPILPILILFSLFFERGLLIILAVVVGFGILGSTTKVVRSLVIQIKEEQFIEAARSYGASRGRILFRYIMPRLMPYTFALIALNVPAFIFLEASLAFLGLSDPNIPTWGSILGDGYNGGALYQNLWWWVAFPAVGILFAAIAFSLLGYSFDRVLNPRLREE